MLNEVVSYIEQCETVRSSASKSSINQPSQRAAWSSFSSPLLEEARLPLHSPLAAIQAITDLSLSLSHPPPPLAIRGPSARFIRKAYDISSSSEEGI